MSALPPGTGLEHCYDAGAIMAAKRRKPKPFRATSAVKAAAREKIGTPPATRAEPSTKKSKTQKPKHKPTLGDLLGEE
jgi:hypothetical protein